MTASDITTTTHVHGTSCWWHPLEARWVCRSSGDPLVDIRDMHVVHTALLREFRLAPAAVRSTDAGDRHRARIVAGHLRFVMDLLHHHHAGEDELLWPLLVERAPARARALADGEAQHAALDTLLTAAAVLRDQWQGDPQPAVSDELARTLQRLHDLLREHLELEERQVLPVAAAVLRPDEWAAIGARAAASMPKPALALAFGMFAYEGDPAVVAQMLGEAPPPARVLLRRIAPKLYARRARRVHGTARP